MVLDTEDNLDGTTFGGVNTTGSTAGTVFKLTPSGSFTTLVSFSGFNEIYPDAAYPLASVILDSEGNFYGTTVAGGDYQYGAVYKITPSSGGTALYSFANQDDGRSPQAGVVRDAAGSLYGTAQGGIHGSGVVFKLTPSGVFTALYSFCSVANCTDGAANGTGPYGVVLDSKGNLYGTTYGGGAYNYGTVFKVTPTGKETVLHSFAPNGKDGFSPVAGVILDSRDNIYGTTQLGGKIGVGTVFEVTATGTETILHSFAGGTGGIFPEAGLIFDTKGNLYSTT